MIRQGSGNKNGDHQASLAATEPLVVDSSGPSARLHIPPVNPRTESWKLLVLILGIGLLLRVWDLRQPFVDVPISNEDFYVTIARNFEHYGLLAEYNYGDYREGALRRVTGPSPLVPWLVYFSSRILGPAEWAARLPMLVLGMAALVILYFIAGEVVGSQIALAATFIAAIMPGIVAATRQVNLDGAMTTFGLAAVLTLLLFQRRRHFGWLFASVLCLGLAIFAKYSGLLFIPCLSWIWLREARAAQRRHRRALWLLVGGYFLIALLPAAAWFASTHVAPTVPTAHTAGANYLLRLGEWTDGPRVFVAELENTWTGLTVGVGRIFWYPLIVGVAFVLPVRRMWSFVRRHAITFLLIVPWFAQMLYPASWNNNTFNYLGPALYGIAIVVAVLGWSVIGPAGTRIRLSDHHGFSRLSVALISGLVLLSCTLDYQGYFHAQFYPTDVVTPDDPFLSAQVVRLANVSHQPILADLPTTLFYAQTVDTPQSSWYGFRDEDMIAAVKSGRFPYVVICYSPSMDVVDALNSSGYRRIAPAAWKKLGS